MSFSGIENAQSQIVQLRFWSPLQILLISIAGYIVIWMIAPLDYVYNGGVGAILYLIFALVILLLATIFGFGGWRARTAAFEVNIVRAQRFTKVLALLGSLGFSFKIFEKIYLRANGEVTTNFIQNRALIEQEGSGPLALLGSTLGSSLMLLPLLVFVLRKCGDKRRSLVLYTSLSALYPLFDLLLLGSRSTFVIYIGLLVALATMKGPIRLGRKKVLFMPAIVLVLLWVFGQLFWLRTVQAGQDPIVSMYRSGYATFVPIQNSTLADLMMGGVSGWGGVEFALVHAGQYFTHGVYEFLYAVDSGTATGTGGLQTLYIPSKLINAAFMHQDIEEVIANGVMRSGVYTTLFGPIYYDFGFYGGLIACAFIGFLSGKVSRRAAKLGGSAIYLHLIIMGGLLYSMAVNLFVSSGGQYLLLSVVIVSILTSIPKYRFLRSFSGSVSTRVPNEMG